MIANRAKETKIAHQSNEVANAYRAEELHVDHRVGGGVLELTAIQAVYITGNYRRCGAGNTASIIKHTSFGAMVCTLLSL